MNDIYILEDTISYKEYIKVIKQYKTLPYEKEEELFIKYNNGDIIARNLLVLHNQRLIISIANKYLHSTSVSLERMDLIMEGNIGLLTAIEKFDISHGNKFSTYATYWINQAILRAIIQKRNAIRTPDHLKYKWLKILKYKEDYIEKHNKEPDDVLLIKDLDLRQIDIDTYNNFQQNTLDVLSLNQKISTDTSDDISEIGDFIEDKNIDISKNVINEDLKNNIDYLLNKAIRIGATSEKNIEIFKNRFGLNDGIPKTLEETGKIYGLTKERIRQIERKVLRFLQRPENKYKLKDFY